MRTNPKLKRLYRALHGLPIGSDEPEALLIRAAESGDSDALKQLIARGASLDAPFGDRTALSVALEREDFEFVRELLAGGADPNKSVFRAMAPIERAALLKDSSFLNALIKAGADVNSRHGTGISILALVCMRGRADVAALLIEAGADVNKPGIIQYDTEGTVPGMTPIMVASLFGRLAIVKLLLKSGADLNVRDKERHTTLDWARAKATTKHLKIVEFLEKKGATAGVPISLPQTVEPAQINFQKAAKQAIFLDAVRRLGDLTGQPKRTLCNWEARIRGPVGFAVSEKRAKEIVAQLQSELLSQGCYLLQTRDVLEGENGDAVALFPSTDIYAVLGALQTEGPNSDVYNRDLIDWLKALQDPLQITGAGNDFVEGKFTAPIKDPTDLAKKILQLCPDGDIEQGAAKQLAKRLETTRELFLWWD